MVPDDTPIPIAAVTQPADWLKMSTPRPFPVLGKGLHWPVPASAPEIDFSESQLVGPR